MVYIFLSRLSCQLSLVDTSLPQFLHSSAIPASAIHTPIPRPGSQVPRMGSVAVGNELLIELGGDILRPGLAACTAAKYGPREPASAAAASTFAGAGVVVKMWLQDSVGARTGERRKPGECKDHMDRAST